MLCLTYMQGGKMPQDYSTISVPLQSNTNDSCPLTSLVDILPQSKLLVATPVLLWILAVVLGTIYSSSPLALLSLRRSLSELTAGRRSRLDVLDVFRVIAILWVMINHTGSEGRVDVLERLPSAEIFKKNVHEHPIFGALLGNSALGVEIFLVLSGLLAARSWLRLADTPFWCHYRKFIGRRVSRLVPSIAVFVYLAAGPFMKAILPRYHSSMISTCGLSGLLSQVTFSGNWQATPTCMGYLWYLGLDMQLYMAAPFLLHLLHRNPRRAVMTVAVAVTASAFFRAAYCLSYGVCNKSDVDIPFISYPGVTNPASIYAGLWEMYSRPHTKCGPFLLGLLVGYFSIHHDKFVISPAKSRLLFLSSLSLALFTIYAILPEYWYPEQGNTLYNTLYTALFRTIFAVSIIGMMISLIYREQGCTVSSKWAVLGRLTYNAYLLHMPVIYVFNHLQYLQNAEGALELMAVVPFVAMFSFATAAVFYLFVEAPLGSVTCNYVTKWFLL